MVASKHISGHDRSGNNIPFKPTLLLEMLAQTAACYAVSRAGYAADIIPHMRLAQVRDIEYGPLPPPPFVVNLMVEHVMDFGGKSLCTGSATINDQIVCVGKLYLSHGKSNV